MEAITWADWVAEFGTFYRSFWGLFGGVNVAAPEMVYNFFNLVALVGSAAFLFWLLRNRASLDKKAVWLLIAWPLILFLLLLRWNTFAAAFQGRLIFPGFGALNILWAVGLLFLAQRLRIKRPFTIGLSAIVFLTAALLPWTTIKPAYQYPEPLAAIPESADFGPFSFQAGGGEIQLIGVEFPAGQEVEPGGSVPIEVVLYWRSVAPVSEDYLSTVHLLGRNNGSVGHVNRYPASGMIPTSQWQSGQIWRDVYKVYVTVGAEAPVRLRVLATLYDAEQERDIPALGPDGSAAELLIVGQARLSAGSAEQLEVERPLSIPLADNITFSGYQLSAQSPAPGDTLTIDLLWQAVGNPPQDYTVFVQLLDLAGSQVAGADGPPMNGDFPTGWWRQGDMVLDRHLMRLPADILPGDYTLSIGLYDPRTGQRPPRLDGQGDAVSLPLTIGR